jgi:hypothetical protein
MSPTAIPGNLLLKNGMVITGTQKNKGLLDEFTGAAAAYSLRDLTFLRGSPVVRVRRDNDNAEQDFTATEVSDGVLAAWVGAGNDGFVRTWYDQSGNGNDAAQTTTSVQPKIVNAGAVLLNSGKPTINFLNDYLQTLSFSSAVAQPSTISVLFDHPAGNADYVFYDGIDAANRQTLSTGFYQYTTSAGQNLRNTPMSDARKLITSIYNGASSSQYINSNNTINGNTGTNSLNGLTIGNNYPGSLNTPAFDIQELILYPSDQSTNRAAIEANINAHYSIYP